MRVLVVTPDTDLGSQIVRRVSADVEVELCADFDSARRRLVTFPPDLLLTDIRLGSYNGLQLVYLARETSLPTRSVVFSSVFDPLLAREATSIGAFYEHARHIAAAARSYISGPLPEFDRRDPSAAGSRRPAHGGRRAADVVPLSRTP